MRTILWIVGIAGGLALLGAVSGCGKGGSIDSIAGEYRVDPVKSLEVIKETARYKALPLEKKQEAQRIFASVVAPNRLILAKDKLTVDVEGKEVVIPIEKAQKTENGFEITGKAGQNPIKLGVRVVDTERIQFFMAGNPGLSEHIWKRL